MCCRIFELREARLSLAVTTHLFNILFSACRDIVSAGMIHWEVLCCSTNKRGIDAQAPLIEGV